MIFTGKDNKKNNMKLCQNAESNENSSSKIEEVPEGRRSMITLNKLTINAFQ